MRRIVLVVLALLASAAEASVPGEVDYQGLLLDSGGVPVNGVVDLEFEIFDAPSGGSSLWSESHDDVSVLDGVYDVTLGQATPLTPELLAGGSLHLEITVEGETLSPRERIVAVPYALRAAHAESVEAVGGVDPVFISQIFEHVNYDGADPPNDDPREGVADLDGDGFANFIDPDNDGDGISDAAELSQGSDMNVPTPVIANLEPASARGDVTTLVHVTGSSFVSPLTVELDGSPLTPLDVTSTSFDVEVGPHPAPAVVDFVVTNPGGEANTAPFTFTFQARLAFISSTQTQLGTGIGEGDAFCEQRAAAAGLDGNWLAWLSDSGDEPASRFADIGLGWETPNGVVIADDLADLTDGIIDNALRYNEFGNQQTSAIPNVFTGTLADGTASGADCSGWTSASGSATAGTSGTKDGRWTDDGTLSCGAPARLYCFEQD